MKISDEQKEEVSHLTVRLSDGELYRYILKLAQFLFSSFNRYSSMVCSYIM
jgi:hypothetical protein